MLLRLRHRQDSMPPDSPQSSALAAQSLTDSSCTSRDAALKGNRLTIQLAPSTATFIAGDCARWRKRLLRASQALSQCVVQDIVNYKPAILRRYNPDAAIAHCVRKSRSEKPRLRYMRASASESEARRLGTASACERLWRTYACQGRSRTLRG